MYCIDTNIIIDILRGERDVLTKVDKLLLSSTDVFITAITLCELYKGAYGHINPDKKIAEVKSFISNFGLLSLDEKSCEEFGKLGSEVKKNGKIVSEFDLIIAAIVRSNNLTLITRDKDFDRIGIKVEIW